MSPTLEVRLTEARTRIEDRLAALLPGDAPGDVGHLIGAMGYSVRGGGKRLRGFLVLEGARLCGAPEGAALEAACAIECIHAYSLVHDDLPAMDDDDLRRGKPTTHKAYDEATAILVGDGLQSLAFELLAGIDAVPAGRVLRLVGSLAASSGVMGMVGGQMRDIAAESRATPPEDPADDVTAIQAMKTGALFDWSAQAGPILADADRTALAAYAAALGRAFQIRDDLLDVEGDAAELGKAVGKDRAAGKATFIDILGVEGARDEASRLRDEAIAALDPYGAEGDILAQLARYTLERTH